MKTSRTPKEMAKLVEDIGPKSTKKYTMCISALGRSRQWERALSLLEAMHDQPLLPGVITSRLLMGACKTGKHVSFTIEFLVKNDIYIYIHYRIIKKARRGRCFVI